MSEQRNRKHKGKLNVNFRNKKLSNQNETVEYKAYRLKALNLNRELQKLQNLNNGDFDHKSRQGLTSMQDKSMAQCFNYLEY